MENNVFTKGELQFMIQCMVNERDNWKCFGFDNIEFCERIISKLEEMEREAK